MPHPTSIKSRTRSRILEVTFDDGSQYELPYEYLRVYSPSAEVRGHGPGQETLQIGKHEVGLAREIEVADAEAVAAEHRVEQAQGFAGRVLEDEQLAHRQKHCTNRAVEVPMSFTPWRG